MSFDWLDGPSIARRCFSVTLCFSLPHPSLTSGSSVPVPRLLFLPCPQSVVLFVESPSAGIPVPPACRHVEVSCCLWDEVRSFRGLQGPPCHWLALHPQAPLLPPPPLSPGALCPIPSPFLLLGCSFASRAHQVNASSSLQLPPETFAFL